MMHASNAISESRIWRKLRKESLEYTFGCDVCVEEAVRRRKSSEERIKMGDASAYIWRGERRHELHAPFNAYNYSTFNVPSQTQSLSYLLNFLVHLLQPQSKGVLGSNLCTINY